MYVLTSSSLTALMSRDLFHEAKNTFWSGYLVAMARWKGCANRFVNHSEYEISHVRTNLNAPFRYKITLAEDDDSFADLRITRAC